jgi:WD40 repeat protein/tRNA A-37 threonylcarbamoyl transferase component Bud32
MDLADSSIMEGAPTRAFLRPTPAPDSERQTVPIARLESPADLAAPPVPDWPQVPGYEILSVIGFGGMGIVYKARHLGLRRLVALKMLRCTALADPAERERFYAEAKAVARLQHANIIQVFEFGTVAPRPGDPGGPFLALEFVEGGNLVPLAAKPQPPRFAAEMVEKLARAVHSAHSLGVIHRDLKPANVLLTTTGEPKVADFGLAKDIGAERDAAGHFLTQAGIVVGTPQYMAPEQACGNAATPAVDIYALGVILYELLTGQVPFQAATPVETLALATSQEPVPPRRLQSGIPRDLETICLKCLEKNPHQRYGSAELLADDLERFRGGRTIIARRATQAERVARWCRRNPLAAASLAGVVAVFLVSFALVSRSYWRAEAALREEARLRRESEEKEQAERWERCRANLLAAASALQINDVTAADRALNAVPEEYRNWEWRHLHSQLDTAAHVLCFPGDVAGRGVLSDDGGRAALFGTPHTLVVWDVATRQKVRVFNNCPELDSAVLSPDGRTLASYLEDDLCVELRDVDTGRVRLRSPAQRGLRALRFSADSASYLTVAHDHAAHIRDAKTGALLGAHRPRRPRTTSIDLSPDFRRAFVRTADEISYLWDLKTGRETDVALTVRSKLRAVNFSPAGDRVLTIEDYRSNAIRLWDAETGRLLGEMGGHANAITSLAFSTDGSRLATGSRDQTIGLWDLRTGRRLATLRGHRGWVGAVAFSPDGTRLVSASLDQTVRVWDANTGAEVVVLKGHTGEVFNVAYTSGGSEIVSASRDGTVRLWDARATERGGVLSGHASYVYSVAFHPDGERVASAAWDGTARVWDATTGRQFALLDHGKNTIVTAVAFHPAGKLLATRARDGVRLWDTITWREVHRWDVKHNSWKDPRLAFSPDGTLLATGREGGTVLVWDVASRKEFAEFRGHRDEVRDLAFSPDGRWLATSGDCGDLTVRVWDLAAKKEHRVLTGHTDCVYALAFSPDGKRLASGGNDGTVRVWDAERWEEVKTFKIGPNVYGLAFALDNSRLACACADNSIRFYDTAAYQPVAELQGHRDYAHALAFSPDGTRLASASGDFTVRIWDTVRPQERARRARP